MKARLLLLTMLLPLMVACGSTPTREIIKETVLVEVTCPLEITRLVQQEVTRLVEKPVTVLVTHRPLPTYTPYPTYTPVSAPTATVSPAPTVSSEHTNYALAVAKLCEEYVDALEQIRLLLLRAADDPDLLFTEDWLTEIGFHILEIGTLGVATRELEPPALFVDPHADLVEATEHFDQSMRLLIEWLDNHEVAKLEASAREMQMAQECLERGVLKLKELQ